MRLHSLRQTPLFRPTSVEVSGPLGDPAASTNAANPQNVAQLLASAIPAVSYAAGANRVNAFDSPESIRNFNMQDMQVEGFWPQERPTLPNGTKPWLHSDLKDLPYPYVYKLFDELVETGELQ